MQYLAIFETVVGDVCQGLVHFPAGPRRRTFYPDRWFRTVERLSAARSGIPGCEVSLRTSLRGRELDQLAFFHAPVAAEQSLRHYLASFLQLLALVDGSVILPFDRVAHDRLADPGTSHLCRIERERYRVGDAWLICDFRVSDFLPELLDEAAALGYEIMHQAAIQSFTFSPMQERRARRNFVALASILLVPTATLEIQQRLLNRSAGEVALVEEYVGTTSAAGATWLQRALRRRFEAKFGPAKFETPRFVFQDNRFANFLSRGSNDAEAIAAGFHSAAFRMPDDEEVFSTAVNPSFASSLFSWSRPLWRWFEPTEASEKAAVLLAYDQLETAERIEASVAATQMAKHRPLLAVCEVGEIYAFISYRRSDCTRIAPILSGLKLAGFPFWFDHGIPGGADWLSELQERLRRARALVLFLSRAAGESRYVRLEASYAFSLGKPILPVRLEEVELKGLPGGLGLLLNSIQTIDFRVEEIIRHLRRYGL